MNYLTDRFLPVRCSDGTTAIVSLAEAHVTEDGRTPVAAAFHDTLLSDVSIELIAGILQVTCSPEDESEWASVFKQGLMPDSLRESFAPFVSGFGILDGNIAFQDRTA